MQFSVIVPIFKVEAYIRRCVDSILAQTFTDFEVLLVDDGSPDACPAICDEYAAKDVRVRVIHKPNGGLVSARNAGIFAARGDFITYVDGDDWIKPNMLEFVHRILSESPLPLDMVMFASENVFDDHVQLMLNKVPEGLYDRARLEKEIFPYLLADRRQGFHPGETIQAHTWNKPCRRELQLAHYVRDERIRTFTDVPMTYECLLNCQNIYICNEVLYYYNQMNTQSILTQSKKNYLTPSFFCLVSYMQERLRGYGIDRQLNDFPASLVIRSAMSKLRQEESFFAAKRAIRRSLNESGILRTISLRGLPRNPQLFILFFKLHCDTAAMLLALIKVRQITR